MKILRLLIYTVATVAAMFALFVVGVRFADGPAAIFPGGAFTSGEINTDEPPDWRFVRDIDTVELQTLAPIRSRTTWILEVDGKIYIPCGYMKTTWGKIWKKWPMEAERDGRAVLRVNGVRYPRHLVRVRSDTALPGVIDRLNEKYNVPATLEAVHENALWIFELQAPRTTS